MKKIISLLLALVMTFGMSSICVSADNEPYPLKELLYWKPYRYYKSYYEFELNWVLDYDEDEINFWPPCCIQCRDSSDGRW